MTDQPDISCPDVFVALTVTLNKGKRQGTKNSQNLLRALNDASNESSTVYVTQFFPILNGEKGKLFLEALKDLEGGRKIEIVHDESGEIIHVEIKPGRELKPTQPTIDVDETAPLFTGDEQQKKAGSAVDLEQEIPFFSGAKLREIESRDNFRKINCKIALINHIALIANHYSDEDGYISGEKLKRFLDIDDDTVIKMLDQTAQIHGGRDRENLHVLTIFSVKRPGKQGSLIDGCVFDKNLLKNTLSFLYYAQKRFSNSVEDKKHSPLSTPIQGDTITVKFSQPIKLPSWQDPEQPLLIHSLEVKIIARGEVTVCYEENHPVQATALFLDQTNLPLWLSISHGAIFSLEDGSSFISFIEEGKIVCIPVKISGIK